MTERAHEDTEAARRRQDTGGRSAADPSHEPDARSRPLGNQAVGGLLLPNSTDVDLPADVRARMQVQLGEDLGGVRVHAGPDAARAADSVEAVAFTTGEDIVLGSVAARPGTVAGDELLAHELTHVVQQRRAADVVAGVSNPTDATEVAADHAAHGHAGSPPTGGAVPAVQRQAVIGKEKLAVKREEVQQVLEQYLEQVLQQQGRRTIEKTPQVIAAISSLFRGNPVMQGSVELWLKGITDGTPAGLARDVARKLPEMVPEDQLDKIRGAPKKASPGSGPNSAADAAGAVVVDSTVAPIVRKLPLSKDKQDQLIKAARSAVADGAMGVLDAALDGMGVGGADKSALHAAVESLIKQEPGKPFDRKQDGAGSPDRKEMPPSVAPSGPGVPGTQIFKGPTIPWDFPGTKAPSKPAAPLPKIEPAVEKAASSVDPKALIPAEVIGTDKADLFDASAVDFALDVARRLDVAHTQKNGNLYIELGGQYQGIKDRGDVFNRAKAIVIAMRDALSHHATNVLQVTFTVAGKIVFSFRLQP